MRSLLRLIAASLVLGVIGQGAAVYLAIRAERRAMSAERRAAVDSAQAVADARWAARQTWATGYYLRDKMNADQALRLEREKCGAW